MEKLAVAQIREADRRCIEELGIPGAVLMNNAGRAVFREIVDGPVGVVCGKGNNGGDGFVVARLALEQGMDTRVVLIGDPESVQGDAAIFMHAYQNLGGQITYAQEPNQISDSMRALHKCSVVVDALLGTGVRGEVSGPICHAIAELPDAPIVAVDVPSGMDSDTGESCGCCVKATTTVTLQYMKRGFDNPVAQPFLGRLVVADIGIPPVCADDAKWRALIDREKS